MNNKISCYIKKQSGVFQGALSYVIWGVLPIYWKALKSIPSDQIIAHRILWSLIFIVVIITATGGLSKLRAALASRRDMTILFFSAVLIGANWYLYIWAVNSNHILEASMGYYITPLLSVLFGVFILKEKLDPYQYAALAFATAGVIVITVQYGKFPWISLLMAATFAVYGLLKKIANVESAVGLTIETGILTPLAATYIILMQFQGVGAFGRIPLHTLLLLLCAGIMTATPLMLFASGARKIEMSTLGFLQYISPTISLLIGVFVYKESFSSVELISFGLIWTGLLIFSISKIEFFRKILPLYNKLYIDKRTCE